MVKRRLNELPNELILTILSTLPTFKESVATRLISKRHEVPWNLAQDVTLEDTDEESLTSFVYGSLLSKDAPTLERLHLKLIKNHPASAIDFWVQTAVNRYVRKLRFDLFGGILELPSCLSTCTTLKSLILRDVSIEVVPRGFRLPSLRSLHLFSVKFSVNESVATLLRISRNLEYLVLNQTRYDVDDACAPPRFCLSSLKSLHLCSVIFSGNNSVTHLLRSCPVLEYLVINQTKCDYQMFEVVLPPRSCLTSSLKTLHLLSVNFSGDESVVKLLKCCEALEDLVIARTKFDNVWLFNITVPTLKRLSINNAKAKRADAPGLVINAPLLERLNVKDTVSDFVLLGYMPEVTTANIEVVCDQSENLIGSLTFIQHLSLCSPTSTTPYTSGTVFFFLEHLELCTCSDRWANLLASILSDAPRLQSIKLKSKCDASFKRPMELWTEPTVVPECLLKHLEILEWREYEGTEQERKVATYTLGNATCLKMATFSTRCGDKCIELEKMSRVSEICQLAFE